jgi:hypothetical protein
MHQTLRRGTWFIVAWLAGTLLLPVSVARASAPLHSGPFTNSYSFIGFNCDGFDIQIEGMGTDSLRSSSTTPAKSRR